MDILATILFTVIVPIIIVLVCFGGPRQPKQKTIKEIQIDMLKDELCRLENEK